MTALLAASHALPLRNPLGGSYRGSKPFGPLFQSFNASPQPVGLLVPGNIDIFHRPVAHNPDGSISTVRSITVTDNKGTAYLIPTVSPDGRVISNDAAIKLFLDTGQHLGIFRNETYADRYAISLHNQQASEYKGR